MSPVPKFLKGTTSDPQDRLSGAIGLHVKESCPCNSLWSAELHLKSSMGRVLDYGPVGTTVLSTPHLGTQIADLFLRTGSHGRLPRISLTSIRPSGDVGCSQGRRGNSCDAVPDHL